MSGTDEGGTAFPFTPTDRSGQCGEAYPGMTLRDYFAAKALMGLCADPNMPGVSRCASIAYEVADAMLSERNKETPR